MRTLLDSIEYEGFIVNIYAEPEIECYSDLMGSPFNTEEDNQYIAKTQRDIDEGYVDYFIAIAEAEKCGIVLGSACIGGNVYKDQKDFVKELHGYHEDLVCEAVSEAKEKLEQLVNNEVQS